jgi:hypothetical protein
MHGIVHKSKRLKYIYVCTYIHAQIAASRARPASRRVRSELCAYMYVCIRVCVCVCVYVHVYIFFVHKEPAVRCVFIVHVFMFMFNCISFTMHGVC